MSSDETEDPRALRRERTRHKSSLLMEARWREDTGDPAGASELYLRVASLEEELAQGLLDAGTPAKAAINLVSAASCWRKVSNYARATDLLRQVLAIEEIAPGLRTEVTSLLQQWTAEPLDLNERRSPIENELVLAIVNDAPRGGMTAIAVYVASALAAYGDPTLLIDFDPQAFSTRMLRPELAGAESRPGAPVAPTLALDDMIVGTHVDNLWLAHSWPEQNALLETASDMRSSSHLRDGLQPLLKRYRFVVIDCPSLPGSLIWNSLAAATDVLVPVDASSFSVDRTRELRSTMDSVRADTNPRLRLLGIVVMMDDSHSISARDGRSRLQRVYGRAAFRSVISRTKRVGMPDHLAAFVGLPPESMDRLQYDRLCEELLERARQPREDDTLLG